MGTVEEITNYIHQKSVDGALMLTGKWGSGKTFVINSLKNRLKNDPTCPAIVVVVSLFGVSTTNELHQLVKEAVFQNCYESLGVLAKVMPKIKKYTSAFNGKQGVISTIGTLASEGLYDLAPVKPEYNRIIDDKEVTYKLALVFDDFERCSLPEITLIGCINSYAENKKVKTILVANEEKIDAEKYKEYKEKLVSRTVKIELDFKRVIFEIVEGFEETVGGYHAFLKSSVQKVYTLFVESREENLRSIKAVLSDFERVYESILDLALNTEVLGEVLYSFGAMMIEHRIGRQATNQRNGFDFMYSGLKERYLGYDGRISQVSSLNEWIVDGVWDGDKLRYEIRRTYVPEKQTPVERFLLANFWDLDMKTIEEGLPVALSLADDGELDANNLIELLQRIHYLKEYGIIKENAVDYGRIATGFHKRAGRIEQGTIQEPQRHRFSQETSLDKEALSLYKEIENLRNLIPLWENKKKLIAYLKGDTSENTFRGAHKVLEVLDRDIFEEIITAYSRGNNGRKRDIALTVLSVYFEKEKLDVTVENLEELKMRLETASDSESDKMTIAINRSFIKELQELKEKVTQ